MRCPGCGNGEAATLERWEVDGEVRRLRACGACGKQFTTSERLATAWPIVVKRDGRRESYRRRKLARAIGLACAKRPIPAGALESLIERVERRLRDRGEAEVSSKQIGELALAELRSLDEVAAVRYASYLRSFASASAFAEEVEALQEWRRRSANERLQMAFDFDADQPHWN